MTAPADFVEVQVPPEQVRVGDHIEDPNDPAPRPLRAVEQVIVDALPDFVYAFTPAQVPLRRDTLVAVYRARTPDPDPVPVPTAADLAAVRDLALALADQASPATKAKIAPAVDRVKRTKP